MFIYLDNQTLTQPLPDLLPFFKQSLEDYWEKEYGQKVDLGPKFKLSDFILLCS